MENNFLTLTKITFLFLITWMSVNPVFGQEYATDRLFLREYNKTKCRNLTEYKINSLKINRIMTLEQEELLNQNVWSKLRTKLPLSPGEKKHLNRLKQRGITHNKISSKNIWARKAAEFKVLRLKCK